jgi:LL-diaminopimelate aminotransferase
MAVGNKDLIAAIDQVKENTDSGIFNAVQYAAIAALEGPQDIVRKNIAVYQKRRDLVVKTLREIGLKLEPPKATFYIWAPIPEGTTSMEFAGRLLDLCGVVVTPGIGYGTLGEGFVRISLSTPDARLEEAMARILKAKEQLSPATAAR